MCGSDELVRHVGGHVSNRGNTGVPHLREPALVWEGLPTHLAGELLSVPVQQIFKLHIGCGRRPARWLLILHLSYTVCKCQGLGGMVLRPQLFGLRLHLCHHILVIAGYLNRLHRCVSSGHIIKPVSLKTLWLVGCVCTCMSGCVRVPCVHPHWSVLSRWLPGLATQHWVTYLTPDWLMPQQDHLWWWCHRAPRVPAHTNMDYGTN